jgi:hypothetical protein
LVCGDADVRCVLSKMKSGKSVSEVVTCLFVFLGWGVFVVILSIPRSSCVCPPLYSIYLPVGVSAPPRVVSPFSLADSASLPLQQH